MRRIEYRMRISALPVRAGAAARDLFARDQCLNREAGHCGHGFEALRVDAAIARDPMAHSRRLDTRRFGQPRNHTLPLTNRETLDP